MVTSSDAPAVPASAAATVARAFPLSAPLAFGAAALCGILYWLAYPGVVEVWPLAFVAWVPLAVALHGQTPARAAWLGGTAGLAMTFAGFFWLNDMLRIFSGFPTPVCVLFVVILCAYQGGRIALLGWLYGRATARGWPSALVFAAAFVASELTYPVLFPWSYAATVHSVPVLSQLGDIMGPLGVGVVLVAANLAVSEIVIATLERRRFSRLTVAVGAGAVGVSAAYGAYRVHAVDAEMRALPPVTVGVVQANMGLLEKRAMSEEGLRRHLTLSHEMADAHADFVVWSETSAMHAVRDDSYRAELSDVARRIGLPAIFGAVVIKPVADDRRYVFYNSAVASDAQGAVSSRYDKHYLLAFGEYLPFGDSLPILYKWSPNSGHFTPGTSLEPLVLDVHGEKHTVSALVCYEDILPRFTNEAVRHANPELLVNLTNDAWFGDTAEPWIHLALTQMRAIEHRRYLVRGTNSGVSAVVDPVGRVVTHGSTFHQEAFTAPIRWMRGWTVYEILGDWPWLFVSLGAFAAAFWRRKPLAPPTPLKASSPS
ncbi:MAG: apolipoprotein N-acyltransferase [Polyangiaceae bacterium]|nr:apolipoprotein N-acyltransferase [Polyangiaceae bacterium]